MEVIGKEYGEGLLRTSQWLKRAEDLLAREVPCEHATLKKYLNEVNTIKGQLPSVESDLEVTAEAAKSLVNHSSQEAVTEIQQSLNVQRDVLVRLREEIPEKVIIINDKKKNTERKLKKHKSIMINLNPFLEFCKEERAFVKLVENAEKTISQIQLMLQREENVKAILQKYKQLFHQGDFQKNCIKRLKAMDSFLKKWGNCKGQASSLRDNYNQILERWNRLKKAMDATIITLSLNQLPEKWKEQCYDSFPTLDGAFAYLLQLPDITMNCEAFRQQGDGMSRYLVRGFQDSSPRHLLAVQRVRQESTKVEYELAFAKRQLIESKEENVRLNNKFKELLDENAKIIEKLNTKEGDKELRESNLLRDSDRQCSNQNNNRQNIVEEEFKKVTTQLAYVENKLIVSEERNLRLANENEELRAKNIKNEKQHIKEWDNEQNGSSSLTDSRRQFATLNDIERSRMESATEETVVNGVDAETMTEFYSRGEDTFVKEVAVDSATDECSGREESLVEEVVSHSTSQLHDGPTKNNREQARQESSLSPVASQGHRIELRNQQIGRQNSTEITPPHDPHRNVLEKSKLVTSSNAAELMRYLSTFLEERKSNGVKSQDLLRRTFEVPILALKIEKKPLMDHHDFDARGMDTRPVWISYEDEECIINYLKTRGFAFLCREGICFYFSVGNRSAEDVYIAIDHMQEALRNICFGRFFGRVVDGHRISSMEDLVISYRVEGSLDPSLTWRFFYVLSNNGISADVRQTGHVLLRKYLCGILLLLFWLMGACIVSKAFRRK